MFTLCAKGGAPSGQTWPSSTAAFNKSRITKTIFLSAFTGVGFLVRVAGYDRLKIQH